jgi:hypothetical protein
MNDVNALRQAKRKGVIIGVLIAITVLGIGAGIPFWWYSSGRDLETFHDGLSTSFRQSVAEILSADRYDAKNALYDRSNAITERDYLLKYGALTAAGFRDSGRVELKNHIYWQGQIEFQKELFDIAMQPTNDPRYSSPENRKVLDKIKANANQKLKGMETAHSMMELCREAVIHIVQGSQIDSDSRCTSVPEQK